MTPALDTAQLLEPIFAQLNAAVVDQDRCNNDDWDGAARLLMEQGASYGWEDRDFSSSFAPSNAGYVAFREAQGPKVAVEPD
jgi:hypothetical protein